MQDLLNMALVLPEKDRADLAASLIASLEEPSDVNAQVAWAEEVRRRVAELDRGEVRAIPWNEARQRIAGRVG